jgi:DNA-binding NarL/FixJ family response regulator
MGAFDDEIEQKKKLLKLLNNSFNGLTKRELEIMILVAAGHTDKHIGEMLHISEHIVGTHHQNLYKKLGVHTKIELYKIVKELGLI